MLECDGQVKQLCDAVQQLRAQVADKAKQMDQLEAFLVKAD